MDSPKPVLVAPVTAGDSLSQRRPPPLGRMAAPALYLSLTVLAWGLLAADRGFFQDDVALMSSAFRAHKPLRGWLMMVPQSTRFLVAWPHAFALLWPSPRLAAQAVYGAVLLGIGMAARALAKELFPECDWLALVAGALTLCASSDSLTNSLVASSYNLSILAFLVAVVCLLRWYRGAGTGWQVAAVAALNVSIWMTDAAFGALLLVPGLLGAVDGLALRRRQLVGAAIWYGSAFPYLALFSFYFLGATSYIHVATAAMSLQSRLSVLGHFFWLNFAPWDWLARNNWALAPAALLSTHFRLWVAGFGTLLFVAAAWWLWPAAVMPRGCARPLSRPAAWVRYGATVAACLLMVLAANGIFVSAPFAEFIYRTHLLSRIWASIALAAVCWKLAARFGLAAALVPASLFVFLGLFAAMERQDYYLGYWRQHRAELRSIVEQVPALRPEATLVLYTPIRPEHSYSATQVSYLAHAWMRLLYPQLMRLFVWHQEAPESLKCRFSTSDLACSDPFAKQPTTPIAISRLVLMRYVEATHRFELLTALADDLEGVAALDTRSRAEYAPRSMIAGGEMTQLGKMILYNSDFAAHRFGIR